MSKNYISISKSYFEKVANQCDKTAMTLNELIPLLRSVSDSIEYTEEEKEVLKKAWEIIVNKLENIEELTEDPNNEFFNAENQEHDF